MTARTSIYTDRPGFDRRMSKEEINACPIAAWEGRITMVRDKKSAERAFISLQKEEILGFDVEIQPCFKKGEKHPPALLQLAGAREVFLFQLNHIKFPGLLRRIFASGDIIKAGVAVADDLEKLRELSDFTAEGFIDLGVIAREAGVKNRGLRGLASVLLGFRISKGCQRSNWGRDTLTAGQIRYAATDAWVGREIYLRFEEMGFTGESLSAAV